MSIFDIITSKTDACKSHCAESWWLSAKGVRETKGVRDICLSRNPNEAENVVVAEFATTACR